MSQKSHQKVHEKEGVLLQRFTVAQQAELERYIAVMGEQNG